MRLRCANIPKGQTERRGQYLELSAEKYIFYKLLPRLTVIYSFIYIKTHNKNFYLLGTLLVDCVSISYSCMLVAVRLVAYLLERSLPFLKQKQ